MKRRVLPLRKSAWRSTVVLLSIMVGAGFCLSTLSGQAGAARSGRTASGGHFNAYGELDCNGMSPIQKPLKAGMLCTDIRGFAGVNNSNNWNNRFYDNGRYIGHDEPDVTFNSNAPGSGSNVTWDETLGKDPSALPTTNNPGHDVNHWFQLSPAPWQSMAMCDGNSYPQTPCTPRSNSNAPACPGVNCPPNSYPGGGSAFMEFQMYPPGEAPFADSISCNNTTWCAALTIDSLECTTNFVQCNTNCEEPVNFGFIQRNGVPAGPPSPQLADLKSFTPNSETLLMNPGDKVSIHMWDALVPGGHGQRAFEVKVHDRTTGQTGWMQASAKNGFQHTSISNCSGTPFNFQPEYSSAATSNIVPWAALGTNISTEFETGHFETCSRLAQPFSIGLAAGVTDVTWNKCLGKYEKAAPGGDGPNALEAGDALCYPKGDTHGQLNTAPNLVTGCQDNVFQNGDLDFDGNAYYNSDWPIGAFTTHRLPSSFVEHPPHSRGRSYPKFFFQTDVALSESTCTGSNPSGCTVPPNGPGHGYPYWSERKSGKSCAFEFGNVRSSAHITDFGGDAQYGMNQLSTLGYPEFESQPYNNTCPAST